MQNQTDMEIYFPKLDIPEDFMAGRTIETPVLNLYTLFPCRIKSAIFFLCTEGEVFATINFSEYTIKKGDFVFIVPDSFIQLHSISDDLQFSFAAFSSGFLSEVNMVRTAFELMPVITIDPVLTLTEKLYGSIFQYMLFLAESYSCGQFNINTEVKKSFLTIFLEQIWELYQMANNVRRKNLRRHDQIYMEFLRLLHQNYTREHRVNFYAEKIGITVQHLCRVVKTTSGRTAMSIIDMIIIMEAKSRLKFTDIPIKNLSDELGFSNNTFFYKWFRKHTGKTPIQYRNR